MRLRKFEIMQYEKYIDIEKVLSWLSGVKCDYIVFKHDKDIKPDGTLKDIHYHIFVKLKDAREINDIGKQVGVETQYINTIKSTWKRAIQYGWHLNNPDKFQYNDSAIIKCNFDYNDIKSAVSDKTIAKENEKEITDLIYAYGECEISHSQLMARISARDYHKYNSLINNMVKYRIEKVGKRNMKVVYISGGSGSGKTTLAKFLAMSLNYDYFVSGSGKDILDGYDREECIILDDLRADTFTKSELFKFLDNNTNSSVKSRYKNKDISSCKLLIITSIKAPFALYNWFDGSDDEPVEQFARRLNHEYIIVNQDGSISSINVDGQLKPLEEKKQPIKMDMVYHSMGIIKSVESTIDSIFDTIINNEKLPF